jgi:hypothetical protein
MSDEITGAVDAAIPTNPVAPVEAPAAPETPAQSTEPSVEEMLGDIYDKANGEPLRGPDGKFASREPKEIDAVEPDAAPVEATTNDQNVPDTEKTEPAAPAIDPPVSWSREVREKWAAIPPDVQQYIAQRETEAHGQISRLGQQVKALEPVAKTLEQYRPTFERNGMDYASGIDALLAAQAMLDVNPRAAILEIAKTYGVDLGAEQAQYEPVRGDDGRYVSPSRESLAMQAKIAELERQIAETRTDVVSTKQREAEQRQAALQSEVEAFAKANPYFNEVEADIAELIPVIRAREPGLSERQILQKAYDKAIRVNDGTFAKIEADRKAKEAAEAKKKADEAKKVSSMNVKTGVTERPTERDVRDLLSSTYDRIQSRAS